ncbi:hypothetical protein A2U01_0078116, partial [Trifolium medium]|nr:hypothetical protein [Trifolium medium]
EVFQILLGWELGGCRESKGSGCRPRHFLENEEQVSLRDGPGLDCESIGQRGSHDSSIVHAWPS